MNRVWQVGHLHLEHHEGGTGIFLARELRIRPTTAQMIRHEALIARAKSAFTTTASW
jgi:hypothetical protein